MHILKVPLHLNVEKMLIHFLCVVTVCSRLNSSCTYVSCMR